MLCSTTRAAVIKCLDSHFARYGVPVGLRTDNGSNLVSEEVEKRLEVMGNVHHCNQPMWTRDNGEVKLQNRESLPRRRERLAAGAQQVSSGLPVD